MSEPSLQERVERSSVGRTALSVLLVVILLAVGVSNLPNSHTRTTAMKVVSPVLNATSLGQGWGLFAPNPTRRTLRVLARIDYDDGTTGVWRTPSADPVIGEYRFYRWRQLSVDAQAGKYRRVLWESLARWVARQHDDAGRTPVRVTLVRRVARTPLPGSDDRLVWVEDPYFSLNLDGDEAGRGRRQ